MGYLDLSARSEMGSRRVKWPLRILGALALTILALDCGAVCSWGQKDASDERNAMSGKPKIDARALVEALVNRNPEPAPEKTYVYHEDFAEDYDPSEDKRVREAIHVLTAHAEETWPELVEHLDDERYCVTAASLSGPPRKRSVRSICQAIVGRSLSEAYYRHLRPRSVLIYARLRTPGITHDNKDLKAWCQKRSKVPLYQLQIEACQWMLTQLKGPASEEAPSEVRPGWIAAIEAEIESLRKTKKAVPYSGFGPEEFVVYSPKKTDKEEGEK